MVSNGLFILLSQLDLANVQSGFGGVKSCFSGFGVPLMFTLF